MASLTIFDIKRFAVHDGPGIRTTVFLKGCPLDCWWCHNPESRKSEPEEVTFFRKLGDQELKTSKIYGKKMTADELMDEILKDKIFFEESGGGVTFSGGEPLYQVAGLVEILKMCKLNGLHVTVDTCGYAPWSNIEKVLPYSDLILYDLKMINPAKHLRFTGVANDLIIQNLERLLRENVEVEVRIPVVPGVNNFEEELLQYKVFLANNLRKTIKIHLLPYHNIGENKYEKLGLENRMNRFDKCDGIEIREFERELTNLGFQVEIEG